MAGITKEEAQVLLDLWIEADKMVATGQSYSIGGRSLTRADADTITKKIKFYQDLVIALNRGGSATVRRIVPRDI
ncbi:MAG: hypothetical protein GTN53_29430 [Candidatus Aminicenantes bacterium]|nr:hypothetical protein [Candidatus Aminicenantes bacterium]NIQ70597.1 hypothetical protein [Candidatus Aminicenantes bacterium]NIT26637.1 hypothetical protein [Candidatus Aminicenantes bacterium]